MFSDFCDHLGSVRMIQSSHSVFWPLRHCDPGRLQNTCDHSIGTDSVIIHSIIMFNLFDVSRSRKFGKTPSVRVRNQEGAGVRFHLELGFGRGGNESTLLIICFFCSERQKASCLGGCVDDTFRREKYHQSF